MPCKAMALKYKYNIYFPWCEAFWYMNNTWLWYRKWQIFLLWGSNGLGWRSHSPGPLQGNWLWKIDAYHFHCEYLSLQLIICWDLTQVHVKMVIDASGKWHRFQQYHPVQIECSSYYIHQWGQKNASKKNDIHFIFTRTVKTIRNSASKMAHFFSTTM